MNFKKYEELYIQLLKHNIKRETELKEYTDNIELYPDMSCVVCSQRMTKKFIDLKIFFRCNYCAKEKVMSVIDSKLETSLDVLTQLYLIVYFVQELNVKQTMNFSFLSKPTIIKIFKNIRKLIYFKLKYNNYEKIGGKNHLVQIDETFFSIRKYNRGRKKKTVIYFGAIDRETKELRIKG